ncbi:MAG: biotin--[acetyl-CoA-carboxylase] ligase, partial [Syntrophaceae bacterium]|nr:biotin--[acetyl-CoA-carboxylase] ligase [Syntrophaceae bacterium]
MPDCNQAHRTAGLVLSGCLEAMDFKVAILEAGLEGRKIGSRLHFLEEVDSTNRLALTLARSGAPEGTVVLADRQTAGRGRLKRPWQSPPGCNIYASLLLRPPISPSLAPGLSLMTGVAVAEAVRRYCPSGVGLKWPNDVRIGGHKVCGILAETLLKGKSLKAVVIGIGLNVNIDRNAFDPELRGLATSLGTETGKRLVREEVAVTLFASLDYWYERFLKEGFPPVREAWLSLSELEGQKIRILFQGEEREGRVAGIDQDGALLICDDQG